MTTTTTTTYPIQSILSALDLLQQHEVISDNLAEHNLGCWLQERGMDGRHLNAETERASEAQQQRLAKLLEVSFESDFREVFGVLASVMTDGFEREKVEDLIADYQDTMGLTDEDELV